MTDEVQRKGIKLGLDFRPIPVDLGDGVEWDFVPDPSPDQWAILMDALRSFMKFEDDDFGTDQFKEAMERLTHAMSRFLTTEEQMKLWVEKGYGLGPQQAISSALMEIWTGFPTNQPSPSGKGSKKTGSPSSQSGT